MSNIFMAGGMDVRQPDGSFKPTHVLIGTTRDSIGVIQAITRDAILQINHTIDTIPPNYTQLSNLVNIDDAELTSALQVIFSGTEPTTSSVIPETLGRLTLG